MASLPFNLGVGGAMRLGFSTRLSMGSTTWCKSMRTGNTTLQRRGSRRCLGLRRDLVLGARFAGVGDYEARGPRRWAMSSRVGAQPRHANRLTDTTSGFKASGPKAVRLFAEHYPAEYLGDTIEALVIASRAGCVVKQVPVAMRERSGGVPSHNPFEVGRYLARAMLALLFALMGPVSSFTRGMV